MCLESFRQLRKLPEAKWRPFCEAHLALNPGQSWADEMLEQAEFSMLEQGELPLCIQHDPWWSHLRRQRVTMILFENVVLPAPIVWLIVGLVFPMIHDVEGAEVALLNRIGWWVVLGSFLLTLPMLIFQAIRVRRILREGAIVRGRCTSQGKSGVYWGKSILEFTFEAESFEVPLTACDSVLPSSGTEVVLRVLPDAPKSFLLLQETGETDGDALTHLKDLTTRKDLYLKKLKTTDAGLVHLKDLSNLEKLSLQYTRVTDSALVNLKGLAKLSRLNLRHTKVTAEGIARLEQALPECKIEVSVRKAEALQRWHCEQAELGLKSEDNVRKTDGK